MGHPARPDLLCCDSDYFLAIRIMAAALRSTSSSVVAQLETLMRIAVWPCHWVPPRLAERSAVSVSDFFIFIDASGLRAFNR
jgi:hypothetical protein